MFVAQLLWGIVAGEMPTKLGNYAQKQQIRGVT